MKNKYNYYRFIIRIERILRPAEIKEMKKGLQSYLQDIAIIDIMAGVTKKPEIRFEEVQRD